MVFRKYQLCTDNRVTFPVFVLILCDNFCAMKKAKGAAWNYSTEMNQDVLQDWQESTRIHTVENIVDNELFDDEAAEEASLNSNDDFDDVLSEPTEVFIEHMDIREPISVLRFVTETSYVAISLI